MLHSWIHARAIVLTATFIASVLSGCVGELGGASSESEDSGPSSGAGDGSSSGAPGSGASTGGAGATTTAASGGSDGSGGPATGVTTGGSDGSTTVSSGSTGGSDGSGSPAGGAGGSDGSGSPAGGSGGSPAGGSGGSGGSPAGGAGGSDGSGGAPTGGAAGTGGSDGATSAAQLCVDTINQHRATLGLPPLGRWTEAESCSDEECESDGNTGTAHGAFGACKERAQNECPGWPGPPESMIASCLQLMWDEGPGEDFEKHGHYINMSNPEFTEVACGFHTFPDGSVWAVQNFR
ncbi:CAP domain-containing protein [Sorangium sp. So ce119]|uniref:CAP domain-containing protein n=1 Tax=Sorangium sp. So ce119 TaxID=3133279 RepID=UPI003F5D6683